MNQCKRLLTEVGKSFVGKDEVALKVLLTILAGGHILLEDIPGVGKTTLALAFSNAMALQYKRIQFTPDVLPSDITGFSIYRKETGKMEYQPGAAVCNLLLADEINRASSRTQSALLETMEEGSVTVDGITHMLPQPFTVIATQNPAGSAGTQLLPNSQLDRFMMCFSIGYPQPAQEIEMLRRKHGNSEMEPVRRVIDAETLLAMREEVSQVFIHDEIYDYIIRIACATREHPLIEQGISPRCSVALAALSQAAAWVQGRDYVVPADLQYILPDSTAHRILLTSQARLQGEEARHVMLDVLKQVPVPKLRAVR
ncbi:AAA family ATPase [Candidatus Soleaferrea massiliensis]|uniref:AAA family ATPase n=1 Tax=Candidatus Soleaferrea massiliensis TaxID=1470354 RepID=UPI000590C376|nr:MoxR family ATPase [Candidatus Soleaferrea massiliensis]